MSSWFDRKDEKTSLLINKTIYEKLIFMKNKNNKFLNYKKSIKNQFKFLKSSNNFFEANLKSIKILNEGQLLPVSKFHLKDNNLIKNLCTWRNRNTKMYFSQFKATFEGTRKWLENLVNKDEQRIMFLVLNNNGKVIGHLGFNNCINKNFEFEIDNVVRVSSINKGLMSKALNSLIEWAYKITFVDQFYLRVFKNNKKAINFYKKNNFYIEEIYNLKKNITKKFINYVPVKNIINTKKKYCKMNYRFSQKSNGKKLILTAGPSISSVETSYAFDAAQNGWNNQHSKYIYGLEEDFSNYVGVKYSIATSSCTGALQIALMSLGIGKDDEVIIPDITWVATANAATYVGATPVFADIDLNTWNIDVNSIKKHITKKTRAIIPVHMYGHPANMTEILKVAKENKLFVVEDAAPSIGAEWRGERAGTFGDFAAFSFQGAKLLVSGEGGILVTNNKNLYEKAKKISDQGRNKMKTFHIDQKGVKFKMSNIQASLALAQLHRIDELIEMKRRIFDWYFEDLYDLKNIKLNKEVDDAKSIYWMTSIYINKKNKLSRDNLIKELKRNNIDTRPVFPPISEYPIWKKKYKAKTNAKLIGSSSINLPSGVCLKYEEVKYVCKYLKKYLD